MSRHASAEDLASLDLDGLRRRKAARVRNHVAGCVRCTQLSSQVSAVPTVLASAPYPSMPQSVVNRLDITLASESTRRLTNAPATEAGRRDLPARRARTSPGRWQLPGLSAFGTRLVAASAALVVLGVGGYEIASQMAGANGTAASSNGSAAVPSTGQMGTGPTVEYGQGSATQTIRTVHSSTNFTPADLGPQAEAAVRMANLEGANGAQPSGVHEPAASGTPANSKSFGSQAAGPASLAGCLDGLVGSRPVQLVDTAKFEGKQAIIIVAKQTATLPAEVWAVGPDCSASNSHVLAHQTLSRT